MSATRSGRRDFLIAAGAVAIAPMVPVTNAQTTGSKMYGLISKLNAMPGQRDALAAILMEGTQAMPGCLSYVIASDPADDNALWLTEVWDTQVSHEAALLLPVVQATVAKARAMIAGFGTRVETVPVGGHGLKKAE